MSASGDIQAVLRKPTLRCRLFGHYWYGTPLDLTCTRCGKMYDVSEDMDMDRMSAEQIMAVIVLVGILAALVGLLAGFWVWRR